MIEVKYVLTIKRKKCGDLNEILNMDNKFVTIMGTSGGGITSKLPIIGLHQESAQNPYLFTLMIDEITRSIQDKVPMVYTFSI